MFSRSQRSAILVLVITFSYQQSATAFSPPWQQCCTTGNRYSFDDWIKPCSRPTALSSGMNEDSESDNSANSNNTGNIRESNIRERKRREVVGTWFRKAMVVGFGYNTLLTAGFSPATASVDDAVNGRIVSFQIQNLNGIEGQTGNIKIQLAPTWAPRGVARFEVRL